MDAETLLQFCSDAATKEHNEEEETSSVGSIALAPVSRHQSVAGDELLEKDFVRLYPNSTIGVK